MGVSLLLDTHALLWWLAGSDHLSAKAHEVVADTENDVFVSAASGWEITTKYRLGKLPNAQPVAMDLNGWIGDQGFEPLSISMQHAEQAGRLPGPHRDPFDRMLIAQALQENLTLVSNERVFDGYAVNRLW